MHIRRWNTILNHALLLKLTPPSSTTKSAAFLGPSSSILQNKPTTTRHFSVSSSSNINDITTKPTGSNNTIPDVTETIRRDALHQMTHLTHHFSSSSSSSSQTKPPPLLLHTQSEISSYVQRNFDTILFDCDGVLYRGTHTVPNASDCIQTLLRDWNKRVLFVTNNAGQNRSQLREKLSTMLDFRDDDGGSLLLLRDEQMISSSYSCARYLQRRLLLRSDDDNNNNNTGSSSSSSPRIFVIGTEGLCDEIRSFGFDVSGGPTREKPSMSRDELAAYDFGHNTTTDDERIDAVVVGLDTEFNYRKLCIATGHLQRNPNAILVATNEDAFDLVGADARHLPGNGALVKALEHCSQRKAVNVGKPSKILAELIREEYDLDPARTLVVGDRLDTDVRFGLDGGMVAALVMTGCTTVEKLVQIGEGSEEEPLPSVIFPHVGLMT